MRWSLLNHNEEAGLDIVKNRIVPRACGSNFQQLLQKLICKSAKGCSFLNNKLRPQTPVHHWSNARNLEVIFGEEAVMEGNGGVTAEWNLVLRAMFTNALKSVRISFDRKKKTEEK